MYHFKRDNSLIPFFLFIDIQGSFCFVFLYYITQKLTHWLFTGFGWKESVLCGKSFNERKKFDLFEKDIRHVCVCCYLSKKLVVIWNDCLFLLNDVLKLFSITYRFKTLLKKITKCNNLIKFVKGLKEKNIYIMCEVCRI